MGEENLRRAQIELEAVEFRQKMAIENPGMYTVEEMRELINRHDIAADEADRAMREDLASMPPEMQAKMKDMLEDSDISEEVWKDIFGSEF